MWEPEARLAFDCFQKRSRPNKLNLESLRSDSLGGVGGLAGRFIVETGSESTMATRDVRRSCTLHGDSFALIITPSLSGYSNGLASRCARGVLGPLSCGEWLTRSRVQGGRKRDGPTRLGFASAFHFNYAQDARDFNLPSSRNFLDSFLIMDLLKITRRVPLKIEIPLSRASINTYDAIDARGE